MRRIILVFNVVLILSLTACKPVSDEQSSLYSGWTIEDLLWLSNAESDFLSQDFVAAYARWDSEWVEFRFDALGNNQTQGVDFWLLLDVIPGDTHFSSGLPSGIAENWDIALYFTVAGETYIFSPDDTPWQGVAPTLIINHEMDSYIVQMQHLSLGDNLLGISFKSILTLPNSDLPLSETPEISVQQTRLINPAPVLLTFWNAMPAVTPAQALRRWNGAHTGPSGRRHGLKHLLDSSEAFGIPIVLLDLRAPFSLSALELLGQFDRITLLQNSGLLIIPEITNAFQSYYEGANNIEADLERFELTPSMLAYANDCDFSTEYSAYFSPLFDYYHIYTVQGKRILPTAEVSSNVMGNSLIQLDENGLSLDIKKALLQVAVNSDNRDLLVLGGSLPDSLWGDPSISSKAMQYLADHPWIDPMTQSDLLTHPVIQVQPGDNPDNCVDWINGEISVEDLSEINQLSSDIENLPDNLASQEARNMLALLTQYSSSNELQSIRLEYLFIIDDLIQASLWGNSPSHISRCNNNSCTLASENVLATIDLQTGSLRFLASYSDSGNYTQWIAPSAQLSVGLSDPSEWQSGLGMAADPAVIPGAFAVDEPGIHLQAIQSNDLTLAYTHSGNGDSQPSIAYQLIENGIRISFVNWENDTTQIPLIINPANRFLPGWPDMYNIQWTENDFYFFSKNQTDAEISIHLEQGTISKIADYHDSISLLQTPEDPDISYPAGHYLPFPLILLEINTGEEMQIQINFE